MKVAFPRTGNRTFLSPKGEGKGGERGGKEEGKKGERGGKEGGKQWKLRERRGEERGRKGQRARRSGNLQSSQYEGHTLTLNQHTGINMVSIDGVAGGTLKL